MRLAELRHSRWAGLVAGLVGAAAVTGLLQLASTRLNVLSLAVCYQLVVLVVSGAFGATAGLFTSLVSVLAFNWFFVPPTHTFTVGDTRNWVSLAVFAATALITSQLAAGSRSRRQEAEARRRDADLLAALARSVLADIGPDVPGGAVAEAAAGALGVERCTIVLEPRGPRGAAPEAVRPEGAAGFAIPLVGHGRPLGLLEVGPGLPGEEPRWARPGFAAAVGGLVAMAVERSRLIAQVLDTEALRRSDDLKTALLSGVSHEFRTPLTAVRAASDALATDPEAPEAAELAGIIAAESERLERLVVNLLDLSRLEGGALEARPDWCDPEDLVAGALEASAAFLPADALTVDLPDDLPLVRADPVLTERVLVNLLHNAVRHGAPPVQLEARMRGGHLEIAVTDDGPGVDPALGGRAFDPFVRSERGNGVGVGLALSRGLAAAQGARLRMEPVTHGARFVLSLPAERAPEPVPW
jgi:two-component system sensor histidine kinase KdpD